MTEGNEEVRELPRSWALTMVQEVIEIIDYRGRTPPFSEDGIPHLRSSNVRNGKIIWKDLRYISEETYQAYMTRGLPEKNDVLFTTEAPLGEVAIAPEQRFSLAQRMMILKPNRKCLLPKFLMYQIQSEVFQRKLKKIGTGTTVAGVSSRNFQLISLAVAPIKEQQQIVEKLEELLSSMNQGIESLRTAQKHLKVYRQVVLKWAFEGKLTERWRSQIQQEKLDIQTGEELLAQIKTERKNRYQQQLAEWEKAVREWEAIGKLGKKPTKPQKPKDLPPLTEAELSTLPHLADEWYWVKIGDLTIGVEYGSAAKSKKEGRVPVLRMGNIQNYVFDWSDLVFSDDEQEIEKYLLKKGDVLFNRTNSPELVGKTAIYQDERPAIFAGYLIKIDQINELVLSKYLNYYLNSITAKKHGNRVKTDGVNQSNINGDKLANYPFPYTSLREQDQIVQEIDSRFSICDQLEATIIETLQKAEALRQSILKQAFEGKLVPQDPNDEPAEKLLERIKQEKLNSQKGKQLSIQGI